MAQSGRHVLAFQAAEQEVKALSLELQQYKDWLSEAQHEVETLERSGRQLADAQKQVQALKSELQKKVGRLSSDMVACLTKLTADTAINPQYSMDWFLFSRCHEQGVMNKFDLCGNAKVWLVCRNCTMHCTS